MKKIIFSLFINLCFINLAHTQSATKIIDLTKFVNPLIGTKNNGNTFAGVSLPFAMVKLGPDCGNRMSNSGYSDTGNIQGFSHVHVSGTGGGPKYGNILFTAGMGKLNIDDYSSPRRNEQVRVGYYSTLLTKFNTRAELTSSASVGFHKYTFPSGSAYILVDLGSFLGKGCCCGEDQQLMGSEIRIISNTRVEGYSKVRGGWNKGKAYTVFFSAEFDTPCISSGCWKDGKISNVSLVNDDGTGKPTGAYFKFKTREGQTVKVKVGISFVSKGKARQNIVNEISHWNFEVICQKAIDKWNKYLNAVSIEGGTNDQKTIFYSALYHVLLMPTNRTKENPLWTSSEPYFDDFYAIWDTFRATNPLLTLLYPSVETNIVRSLINIYENEGYMPDARSGNDNGRTQGGSNGDMLVADAYIKDLQHINFEKGYNAMIKDAEVPPGGNEQKQGRGGINDYNKLGYVSTQYERSGSRTLEYSNNDYAISVLAKGLGKQADYSKYIKRASNWTNLWKPITNNGAKGFIMPKKSDGNWNDSVKVMQNPVRKGWHQKSLDVLTPGTWNDVFYESHSWEYSFYVPQDVKRLIDSCGGKKSFIARLDTFFKKEFYNLGNEPGFLAPCLYNYVGLPAKTAQIVHEILKKNFKSTNDGLPGNDDSGSMSAWFIFHTLGFYPNTGQNVYLISTPSFPRVTIHLENGKFFRILSKNISEKNIFIKSAKLNGKNLNQSWFKHTEIVNGGTLEFEMTDKPTGWATNNVPPSMSDEK